MKRLLEAINRGILKGLTENNIELLADLDDDNLDQLSIQTKSINNKIDMSYLLIQQAVKTGKITWQLKTHVNNSRNFNRFKNAVKANNKDHLKELITIGQKLFGDDGNFNWIDTSSITDMSSLFGNNIKFNGHIELWDVSNVKHMLEMFYSSEFNGDISKWDVRNVKYMQDMFYDSEFNGDISKWDVSNVEDMSFMFANSKFNGNISMWKINKKCKTICMFE